MTKENSSKKHVFPKNVSRTALLHPRTLKQTATVNPTSPLSRNKKSLNQKRLLLRMTCQFLTDYVKVAFHMMTHLLMMMLSTSLLIVMMMHLLIPEHLLNPTIQIIIRYSIFFVVLDLYSYLYDCMIYVVNCIIFLLCMIVYYTQCHGLDLCPRRPSPAL